MEFTDEQERMIESFQAAVQDLVVGHARNREDAVRIADLPEFYAPLCDMVAEWCANHAVDIEYPLRETDDDGEERILETCKCTDPSEREWWKKWLETAKGENT